MKADELHQWIKDANEDYVRVRSEFGKLGMHISFDTYLILKKE